MLFRSEACPLSLAPTTSTTATMSMGDALAVSLMEERNFQPEDFARFHPGGSLGRKLLTRVSMLMRRDKLPTVNEKSTIIEVLDSISSGRLGITLVFDDETLVGVITDGDLRRLLHTQKATSFTSCAKDFMTMSPKCINENDDLVFAVDFFAKYKISNAVVLDHKNKVVGLLNIYDVQT